MIDIDALRKTYPGESQPVLRDVRFSVAENEYVSLMGASGSGKTTILNVMGGLDSDYEGKVVIHGQELRKLSDKKLSLFRNETIGFVFQAFNLLEHMTCGENVEMPAYFGGKVGTSQARARALECLDAVGLAHKASHSPRLLSGGERQRIAIARALFNRPKILLCDEPTGALDKVTGESVLELFENLNQSLGVTVVLVTHSERVSERTHRVIRVEDGQIREAGA